MRVRGSTKNADSAHLLSCGIGCVGDGANRLIPRPTCVHTLQLEVYTPQLSSYKSGKEPMEKLPNLLSELMLQGKTPT